MPLSLQEGWTPLHLAVQSGRLDVIKLLLSRGADTSIENKVCLDRVVHVLSPNFLLQLWEENLELTVLGHAPVTGWEHSS